MSDLDRRILYELQLREAVASVSLSHREDCACLTCRAAGGDEEAMVEVIETVMRHEGRL